MAGSSLVRDRSTKQRIYAKAGIERYVIINLVNGGVESYSQPIGGDDPRYGRHETLTEGPVELGLVRVDTVRLLG